MVDFESQKHLCNVFVVFIFINVCSWNVGIHEQFSDVG